MQQKDTGLALVLEILPGIFGFLGIGYIYAGYTKEGIIRLIGWWVILGIGAVISVLTAGIGIFCLIPMAIVGPIVSGLLLKKRMTQG